MKGVLVQYHGTIDEPVGVILPGASTFSGELIHAHIKTWSVRPGPYELVYEQIEEGYFVVRVVEAGGYDNPNDVFSVREVELVSL